MSYVVSGGQLGADLGLKQSATRAATQLLKRRAIQQGYLPKQTVKKFAQRQVYVPGKGKLVPLPVSVPRPTWAQPRRAHATKSPHAVTRWAGAWGRAATVTGQPIAMPVSLPMQPAGMGNYVIEGTELEGIGDLQFSLKPPKWVRKMQPGKILKKVAVPLALVAGAVLIPGAGALAVKGVMGAAKFVGGKLLMPAVKAATGLFTGSGQQQGPLTQEEAGMIAPATTNTTAAQYAEATSPAQVYQSAPATAPVALPYPIQQAQGSSVALRQADAGVNVTGEAPVAAAGFNWTPVLIIAGVAAGGLLLVNLTKPRRA